MEIAEHYHVSIDTDDGQIELLVTKGDKNYEVIDDWGELTGVEEKKMAEFPDMRQAVYYAITMLKKKYPKGRMIYGAGCPPKEWLEGGKGI